MIKRCKRDWAMIRYAYALKINVACALIFMAIGLLTHFLSGGVFFNGSYFAMLAPTFLVQIYNANSMALMVQASPRKKAMQTVDVAVYSGASILVIYLVLAAIPWLQHKGALPASLESEWEPKTILFSQFWLAALGVLLLLYTAAAYKVYWVSVVVMLTAMIIFSYIGGGLVRPDALVYKWLMAWPFGYAQTVALGSAMILAGTLLAYLLGCLLYRRPMSKASQSVLMRREMMDV